MAGLGFTVVNTTSITTGTSKKTILQIVAPTNQRLVVDEWWADFAGVEPTDVPVLVEVWAQSSAGSGGTPVTPSKQNTGDDETLQVTAQEDVNSSTQPTDTVCHFRRRIHPQEGITWKASFGKEIVVKGGQRLAIAITAAVSVIVQAGFRGQE